MIDTGGHRASIVPIKDASCIEFKEDYQVFVNDLGKDHVGWLLNNIETYKVMVKHVQLSAMEGVLPWRWRITQMGRELLHRRTRLILPKLKHRPTRSSSSRGSRPTTCHARSLARS